MISIEHRNHLDCCGIKEFSGFYCSSDSGFTSKQVLSAILKCYETHYLPAVVLFSGAEYQKDLTWNPYAFAEWLEKEGERVIKTEEVMNHNSNRNIQVFLWTPSREFRDKLAKVRFGRKTKKNAASGS